MILCLRDSPDCLCSLCAQAFVWLCLCVPRDRHLERDFLFFEKKDEEQVEKKEKKDAHKTRIRELMQRVISEESITKTMSVYYLAVFRCHRHTPYE